MQKKQEKTEQRQRIEEKWNEIPFQRIITLIDSMSLHCAEVIRSLGFPTRY